MSCFRLKQLDGWYTIHQLLFGVCLRVRMLFEFNDNDSILTLILTLILINEIFFLKKRGHWRFCTIILNEYLTISYLISSLRVLYRVFDHIHPSQLLPNSYPFPTHPTLVSSFCFIHQVQVFYLDLWPQP